MPTLDEYKEMMQAFVSEDGETKNGDQILKVLDGLEKDLALLDKQMQDLDKAQEKITALSEQNTKMLLRETSTTTVNNELSDRDTEVTLDDIVKGWEFK